MPRFFVPDCGQPGDRIVLDGDNARHISYSLRMRRGDTVTLCGEDGRASLGELEDFDGETVAVRILGAGKGAEPPFRVTLYQGLTKGDKLEYIIQKAVETGVTRIVPFVSSHCIAKLEEGAKTEKKLERWNRISEEAAKQCGRGIVPEVSSPVPFEKALEEASASSLAFLCYEREDTVSLSDLLNAHPEGEISFFIGPEGGFSEKEAALAAEKGLSLCGLGKRILRTETAPIFVLSCITYEREL